MTYILIFISMTGFSTQVEFRSDDTCTVAKQVIKNKPDVRWAECFKL